MDYMSQQGIRRILERAGVIIVNSHIVYASGRHGTTYVNKDAIYPNTAEVSQLGRALAQQFADNQVQIVLGPAIGGVILSQWTADHLTRLTGQKVLSVYAEKEGSKLASSSYGPLPPKYEDAFVIKRGYGQLIPGKNVLVVEDVLTTGGTAKRVVEAVRAIGGNVVGLGAICNRGAVTSKDVGGVPKFVALTQIKLEAWDEAVCPLCQQNVPINTDVGKGWEFLARRTG